MKKSKTLGNILTSILVLSILIGILIYMDSNGGGIDKDFEMLKTEKLEIIADIDKYALYMSSTIGMPFRPNLISKDLINKVEYEWSTDYGKFLDSDVGKIEDVGKKITNDGQKVFWNPRMDEVLSIPKVEIKLKVKDKVTKDVISEASIWLMQDKDGVFTVLEP
ncbi:MAG TPA: hypothetical protein DCP90_00725 [Clostridiales bacterium]|nr:MAG: hypothetical protein A2Y22_08015 [Clostridiales bacterium GWD2_32_59]HAN09121.1 hypothetical protein [Clostridiales bacterium]